MAITTTIKPQFAAEWELLLPQMATQPLRKALENINYHWKYYRPALVSFAPTADPGLTRSSEYHIPIQPSADGLRYTFETRFICSAAAQNVTVTVEYTTAYVAGGASVWVGICSDVVVSNAVGGALTTVTKADQTIPATAVALKWSLTAPAAGDRTDHHLVALPTPAAPVAGLQLSGYAPFDDTLLLSGDQAAVHTEWLNRCKFSMAKLLLDRQQNAYSFGQEYRSAPRWTKTNAAYWSPLPPVRIGLPGQSGVVSLLVSVIAEVSAGNTSDLVRLRQ
ncbi:MAG: hypothetical protein FJ100_23855, partial [Deltaproteobacteria bacterium]|nr:hypothetical protein [Deltaproteobacteria bacterium]